MFLYQIWQRFQVWVSMLVYILCTFSCVWDREGCLAEVLFLSCEDFHSCKFNFTPLGWKSKSSAHAQLMITLLYILLRNIFALASRITLDKWGRKMTSWMWSYDFSWYFLQFVQLFSRNVYISSWLLDATNLAKEECKIYRPQYIFRKNYVIKLI